MWIISTKTLKAWQRLICCNSCKGPNTQKYHTTMITNHPSISGVNGSATNGSGNGLPARYPLIPPSRNPPPAPPPTSSHYIPLSVMTTSGGGGNNCASVTYTGSNDWKSSKIL
uniref:Uncharacterized protein n=1 Tax=Panagrolaimus sp. ES5 TaxID=591445 RepID=A0AC34F745_9BILA